MHRAFLGGGALIFALGLLLVGMELFGRTRPGVVLLDPTLILVGAGVMALGLIGRITDRGATRRSGGSVGAVPAVRRLVWPVAVLATVALGLAVGLMMMDAVNPPTT